MLVASRLDRIEVACAPVGSVSLGETPDAHVDVFTAQHKIQIIATLLDYYALVIQLGLARLSGERADQRHILRDEINIAHGKSLVRLLVLTEGILYAQVAWRRLRSRLHISGVMAIAVIAFTK